LSDELEYVQTPETRHRGDFKLKSWSEIRNAATALSKRWKNAYDAQSRLSSVSALVYTNDEWHAELLVSNRYDHIGRRVKKITPAATHTFFYDGWNLIGLKGSAPSA